MAKESVPLLANTSLDDVAGSMRGVNCDETNDLEYVGPSLSAANVDQ